MSKYPLIKSLGLRTWVDCKFELTEEQKAIYVHCLYADDVERALGIVNEELNELGEMILNLEGVLKELAR